MCMWCEVCDSVCVCGVCVSESQHMLDTAATGAL